LKEVPRPRISVRGSPSFWHPVNVTAKPFRSTGTVDASAIVNNINGRDVQRKNVVNNVDKSSLWAP